MVDDLTLEGASQINGHGRMGENGYEDEYGEEPREEPLGHNIEHACR